MKNSEQEQPEKKAKKDSGKKTSAEKAQRKAAKAAARAADTISDSSADKKAGQKKTLKLAAKQLQKELDQRMSEVVKRIRKETKEKLKEVVKEATQRLDVDTAHVFEQALHSIVQQHDQGTPAASDSISAEPAGSATQAKPGALPKATPLSKNGSALKANVSNKAVGKAPSAPASARSGAKPAATPTAPRRNRSAASKTDSNPTAASPETAAETPATSDTQ